MFSFTITNLLSDSIAGSDTTTTVLRTVTANVMAHPDVYRCLQAEIDDAAASGKISSPITDAEARKLRYLQACLKEGLRIWPPITGIMPRVSSEDTVICGIPIPAGTNIAWSAHAVMRNKDVFGVDADMYRPSRWLEANADQIRTMDNTVDLCFGQGTWGCLGRPIAMLELNKMVVEVSTMTPCLYQASRGKFLLTICSCSVALISRQST